MDKRLFAFIIALLMALVVAPASAGAELDYGSALVPEASSDVEALEDAVAAARSYCDEQGFSASAFKDALEYQLDGARCYSVSTGRYYIVYGGNSYYCEGSSVSLVPEAERIREYASLDAAREAAASESAFVTRGCHQAGDGGHAYYEKTTDALQYESLEATAPIGLGDAGTFVSLDATIDQNRYRFISAESTVNVYQLGYSGGDVRPYVHAFEKTGFHTLAFPEGEYLLGAGVWAYADDRAYYGFGATLYTNDDFRAQSALNAVWMVRGEVIWGGGRDDDGKPVDVFKTVDGMELNGVSFERRTSEGHNAGYKYGVFVRNAENVTVNHCEFIDEAYALVWIEMYGNYENVSVLNSKVRGSAAAEIRDLCNQGGCSHVVVKGCEFYAAGFDECIAIFAGNEQGLTNSDGVEYPILENCLVEDVLIEDNTITMAPSAFDKKRVVAITCGYQDSPVRNVRIRNNDFDVYAESYLMLVGYVEQCSFTGNRVKIRSVNPGRFLALFERADHSRTKPTQDLVVDDNVFVCPDEDSALTRLNDRDLGSSLTFEHNVVDWAGKVTKLLDSSATYARNTFNLHDVGSLYSNVGTVTGNSYSIGKLDNLFEGNAVNARADIVISDEKATIAQVPSHLMGFYGTGRYAPTFNGHSLTFSRCRYDIADASYKWRRIAYDPKAIADGPVTVTFQDCYVPGFDEPPYNRVDLNDDGKVVLATSFIGDGDMVTEATDPATQVKLSGSTAFMRTAADEQQGRSVVLVVEEKAAADYADLVDDAHKAAYASGTAANAFSVELQVQNGSGEVIERLTDPAQVGRATVTLPVGQEHAGETAKVYQFHEERDESTSTIVHDEAVDDEGMVSVPVDRLSGFVVMLGSVAGDDPNQNQGGGTSGGSGEGAGGDEGAGEGTSGGGTDGGEGTSGASGADASSSTVSSSADKAAQAANSSASPTSATVPSTSKGKTASTTAAATMPKVGDGLIAVSLLLATTALLALFALFTARVRARR